MSIKALASNVSLLILLVSFAACESPDGGQDTPVARQIELTSAADSLAMRVIDAFGGMDTWQSIPYMQFDFAAQSPNRSSRRRHLWDRNTGRYRVEYAINQDSSAVVLFNVHSKEGTAYINGNPVDEETSSQMVARAHRLFINDTYWLMAPTKLFDDGVNRSIEDTTLVDAQMLALSFDSVGYTPGDQYWLTIDNSTGRVAKWEYELEGSNGNRGSWAWEDYRTYETPAGDVVMANAKRSGASETVIMTDNIAFPAAVDDAYFTDASHRIN